MAFLLVGGNAYAHTPNETKKTKGKGLDWCYRTALKVDRFLLRGIDTSYIGLPEHSWRVAVNSGIIGINSRFGAENILVPGDTTGSTYNLYLHMRTKPTVNLGFNIGLRGFGFGYSWDLMDSRAKTLSFSFGGKYIGIEFLRQSSSNIKAGVGDKNPNETFPLDEFAPFFLITNTSLSVWYALNSARYSHNAAIKQSYIQRRSAGSLLLQIHYASTQVELDDRLHDALGNLLGCETHQVGVGLGYGINYTPNRGKVLLHASAMAQLICFSHNLISQYEEVPIPVGGKDTTIVTLYALYRVPSRYPVHVTGTMRAAVSWEINKWVHLSAWGQVNNTRFMAHAMDATIDLRNWNWQANLSVAVRLGAGNDRIRKRLGDEEYNRLTALPAPSEQDLVKLPNWFTSWFFSPKL